MGCDLFTCNRLPCQGKDGTVSGREMPCQIGSAPPGRGGLCTPTKEGMTPAHILFPFGHWPFARPSVIMTCPDLRWPSICGRAERVPPRKPPSALSPGLPRKAIPARLGLPAEGRALHARNVGITLTQMLSPFGYRLIVKPPMATQCVGIRTAVPCGRGDRAPPRKPPSASSPAFPRKAIRAGLPPRGWAGSARPHLTPEPLSHPRPKTQGGRLW